MDLPFLLSLHNQYIYDLFRFNPYSNGSSFFISLITIGARPAMGKTAFGLNLSRLTAKKHNVLYVNLEM